MVKSNNPAYSVLELNEHEHEYLVKLFTKGHKQSEANFREICSMPSTDERAQHRSLLSMGATFDMTMYSQLREALLRQHPCEHDWVLFDYDTQKVCKICGEILDICED